MPVVWASSPAVALFKLSADEIVSRLPTQTIRLLVAENPVGRRHSNFLNAARRIAKKEYPFLKHDDVWDSVLETCNVHHKRPRELDGRNNNKNLVVMDREVHTRIHKAINQTLKAGNDVVQRFDPRLTGERKTLLGWIREGWSLTPIRPSLQKVEGFSFDQSGKPYVTIPYPEGVVFIPRFLSNYASGRPVSEWQGSPSPLKLT